jgi:hypothetical protein
MNPAHKLNETPKERLVRVAESSQPLRRELRGRNCLIAAGLLLLLFTLVVVGIVGGMLGSDVVAGYARRISEWARPAGR